MTKQTLSVVVFEDGEYIDHMLKRVEKMSDEALRMAGEDFIQKTYNDKYDRSDMRYLGEIHTAFEIRDYNTDGKMYGGCTYDNGILIGIITCTDIDFNYDDYKAERDNDNISRV